MDWDFHFEGKPSDFSAAASKASPPIPSEVLSLLSGEMSKGSSASEVVVHLRGGTPEVDAEAHGESSGPKQLVRHLHVDVDFKA